MNYKQEPWFALLKDASQRMKKREVAAELGVSPPVVTQVLNGTGKYGAGEASTDNLAARVVHTFGQYPCPHLSEQSGFGPDHAVITAQQCRKYAHRPAPTGSPRDLAHWQACNACPHKALVAPPQPREVKPRKRGEEVS